MASVEVTFLFQLNGDRLSKTPSLVAISEYFLHDFFLIVNLAAPGACNFYGTKIIQPEDRFAEQINLSNVLFESSILDARSDSWPKVGFLNLSEVIVWFYSIRSEMKLLPKNRMERVVFAMLHLCKAGISPTNVIWIFYGLETLFDTKIGENFRTLVSRIQLLLDLSEAEFKILKKKMRELYDIRSAFVHGGLEVIHPLQNEMLDKSVDEMTSRFIDTADFGFRILLASVQEIIRRGWREPNFREVLEGIAR
ncbi:hypothetical protein C9E91_10985 [Rhizobium sp. SEMIA4064]|nr:hypothetical protein C9E91_10985 [Rhizobium sp. SEMIA4064]